ncbi:hypothetical protein M3765_12415 [Streptomyces thermoviolaceus]|uniref:hypothetical protein n=1 Tax=Streptomyces thermoviolaceus TaxID=1952 RepID=UPI0020416ED9|nr:hypothetical protein [Streptomyces thermoviolaceus]MCM3264819.1 hypothetical protein [Streptomyces thermoviolaceus]
MTRQTKDGGARRQPERRQDGAEHRAEQVVHRTETVERGRFCPARCTCGRRGPARRVRSPARRDAEQHADGE